MKNAMQLKALIKNMAKEKNIAAQLVLQNYMLERFLERVSILAEKLETVISRGDQNTRPRDYYDIYILTGFQEKNIDMGSLSLAIGNTAKKRATTDVIKDYKSIMETVKNSDVMIQRWNDYRKDFDYAQGIEFNETCEAVVKIMDSL
jgi:hypothetical protein